MRGLMRSDCVRITAVELVHGFGDRGWGERRVWLSLAGWQKLLGWATTQHVHPLHGVGARDCMLVLCMRREFY